MVVNKRMLDYSEFISLSSILFCLSVCFTKRMSLSPAPCCQCSVVVSTCYEVCWGAEE
jgi:hypothetical protein